MIRKSFRTRVSILLLMVLVIPFGFILFDIIRSGRLWTPEFFIFFVAVLVMIVYVSISRYVISGRYLLFKLGSITCISVNILKMQSIERSYDLFGSLSYAAVGSYKKLKINLPKGYDWPYFLISPGREQEFLDTLKEINPNLNICVNDKKGWYRIWDWDI